MSHDATHDEAKRLLAELEEGVRSGFHMDFTPEEYALLLDAMRVFAASEIESPAYPKAYMVERDSEDPPRLYLTEALAKANAAEGLADTHVIPLYSARQLAAPSATQALTSPHTHTAGSPSRHQEGDPSATRTPDEIEEAEAERKREACIGANLPANWRP